MTNGTAVRNRPANINAENIFWSGGPPNIEKAKIAVPIIPRQMREMSIDMTVTIVAATLIHYSNLILG